MIIRNYHVFRALCLSATLLLFDSILLAVPACAEEIRSKNNEYVTLDSLAITIPTAISMTMTLTVRAEGLFR